MTGNQQRQIPFSDVQEHVSADDCEAQRQRAREAMPPVHGMVLLQDFEFWAHKVLSEVAWAYYRSAADQERSYDGSMEALRRYFFRPRMLRDMSNGSTKTSFLGITSELPIYIAPAAMAKLGHPLGEVNLTKAAGDYGIVQSISANTSCSLEEIFDAKKESQALLYQIYIDRVRSVSAEILQKVERLGVRAIIFTVDVGWGSKRTLEARTNGTIPKSSLGAFMAMGGLQDRNLSWDDIAWIRRHTKLPIIVKGVQSIEDVDLCVKHGAEGVMISNHGGRQVDYAPAPIDILYEIRTFRPDLFGKIDIMIDGGVRSGADVVKLLALGAKAVGFGRTFLYANGTHGEEGVRRVIEILREEIVNTMRNIGAATISDLKPEMVGPAGPWVGANRPSYATMDWKL
ncbi:FMN-dependent dehydrogenase [Lophiotrema nucula]|uniref:FMN-dependent dehydrogenase n=1 Tax=Lophiotrema nucula TaxID=690887 RepID=A0A6A5ZH02_9PLEO|nr:FMN-dependent dehydrogenase [Lophiotrema nucula]